MLIIQYKIEMILLLSLIMNVIMIILMKMKHRKYMIFKRGIDENRDILYSYQIHPKRKFLYASKSSEIMFGHNIEGFYNDSELIFSKVHPDDYEKLEKKIMGTLDYSKPIYMRWITKDGNYVDTEDYVTPYYRKGKLIRINGSMRDITKQKELEHQVEYTSIHDLMTKCFNRNYYEKIYYLLDVEKNISVGIVMCDINDLKKINDIYGHSSGDKVIKNTADLLNQFAGESNIICRTGGDEFVVFLLRIEENDLHYFVRELSKKIEVFNEQEVNDKISLAIGTSFTEKSKGHMKELFSVADEKMYMKKTQMKIERNEQEVINKFIAL